MKFGACHIVVRKATSFETVPLLSRTRPDFKQRLPKNTKSLVKTQMQGEATCLWLLQGSRQKPKTNGSLTLELADTLHFNAMYSGSIKSLEIQNQFNLVMVARSVL